MNKQLTEISIDTILDNGEIAELQPCTYCNGMRTQECIASECNGDCGDEPNDFSDLQYNQELNFHE